jgi:hypothetical protein
MPGKPYSFCAGVAALFWTIHRANRCLQSAVANPRETPTKLAVEYNTFKYCYWHGDKRQTDAITDLMHMVPVCKEQRPCFSTRIAFLALIRMACVVQFYIPVLCDRRSLLLLSVPCLSLQNFLPCISWRIYLALLNKVKYRSVIGARGGAVVEALRYKP